MNFDFYYIAGFSFYFILFLDVMKIFLVKIG